MGKRSRTPKRRQQSSVSGPRKSSTTRSKSPSIKRKRSQNNVASTSQRKLTRIESANQIPQIGRFNDGEKVSWDNYWDVAPSKRNKFIPESTAVRHIIMIRHAHYYIDDDEEESVLTDLGIRQATYVGKRIRDMKVQISRLVHSDMDRAVDTARIIKGFICEEEDMLECPLLGEGAPICPVPAIDNWTPDPKQVAKDGLRIETAFREYFHRAHPEQVEDSYDILVCHANVIRYLVCRALQFPAEAWLRVGVANASITMLTIECDGTVCLRDIGNTGFMEPEEVSFN